MIEYVLEYVPWVLAGILFLLVLSLLASRFFRQKPIQHSRESEPYQGYAGATLDPAVGNHSQTLENTVNDLKQHSSDLNLLLQGLTVEIQGVRESLNQIAELLQSQVEPQTPDISSPVEENEKVPTLYQNIKESPQLPESESGEWMSSVLMEFCNLYNARQLDELQTRYQPHYRISVVNAMERRQDSSKPPLFENSTKGKLLVYYIEAEDLYVVVPSYGLVLDRSVYGPGAFGEVFNCPGFESQHSYHIKVIRPAVFKPDLANQSWTPEEKGQLELELIS